MHRNCHDDKSRLMTKPTTWLCAQRRLRSAWAFAQSDQSLRCALNGLLSSCGQRRLWSDWADTQADLSLRWVLSHFVGFVTRRLISLTALLRLYPIIIVPNVSRIYKAGILRNHFNIGTAVKLGSGDSQLLFFFFFFFYNQLRISHEGRIYAKESENSIDLGNCRKMTQGIRCFHQIIIRLVSSTLNSRTEANRRWWVNIIGQHGLLFIVRF